MRNTRPALSLLLSMSLLLSAGIAAAGDPVLPDVEHNCRGVIQSSLRHWLKQTVRVRQKCQSDTIGGFQDPGIDCLASGAGGTLGKRLDRIDAKLRRSLLRSCGDAALGLLSYPGLCADADPFDVDALGDCIVESGTQSIAALFDKWYPDSLSRTRGSAGACLKETPKKAFGMVIDEVSLRLNCLFDVEGGKLDAAIDCRAATAPAGPGTGDASLDEAIGRAQLSWLGSVPEACAVSDLDALGYGSDCGNGGDGQVDLRDLKRCVYDANNDRMPFLLDLAFPSDPVCGNGVLQEGEVCDEGLDNSDTTPDACRKDCTLPVCGDGVKDPSNDEGCDDGNHTNLDGCNASCVAEFCGDGIKNGKPAEDCDDDNGNPADSCTNTCKSAVCGDDIVCTDASCTTGPGGGVEQCDAGANNVTDGACRPDCSGYRYTCTLAIGVTSSATLGALTYELNYSAAGGDFLGNGATVQCTSSVAGGLFSFFENPVKQTVKESLINSAGFQAPVTVAQCKFATGNPNLTPGAFSFLITSSTTPDFEDVAVTMGVTSINCTFD